MPQCYFDKGDVTIGGWSMDVAQDADGDLRFSASFGIGNEAHRETVGGAVATGQWARIVATWDGSGAGANIHIYVNGAEASYAETLDATGARPDDSTVSAAIGCNATTGFSGLVDDVRLYDRVLSPAEVGQL